MILPSGYHDNISMKDYLADPCAEPSLSTGTICDLYERSPAHAFTHHPRLGKVPSNATTRGDVGSAVHSLSFGGADVRYVGNVSKRSGKEKGIPFLATDWSTADAQEAQAEIRESGAIPLLEHQRNDVERASENVRKAIAERFGSGKSEQTMVWQHNGVWHRGRADWLDDNSVTDVDLKTVDNADALNYVRRVLFSQGYDVQAGNRAIGHEVLGKPREMRWLLVELTRPWATHWLLASPRVLEGTRRKISHVQKLWRASLDAHATQAPNAWPAYGSAEVIVEPPPYVEWDLEARGVA